MQQTLNYVHCVGTKMVQYLMTLVLLRASSSLSVFRLSERKKRSVSPFYKAHIVALYFLRRQLGGQGGHAPSYID